MERLYRALEIYSQEDYYPFHMPGHKRNPDTVNTDLPFDRDITEIDGFDNLHHPEGILKKAQETAASVYDSTQTKRHWSFSQEAFRQVSTKTFTQRSQSVSMKKAVPS